MKSVKQILDLMLVAGMALTNCTMEPVVAVQTNPQPDLPKVQ